MEIRALLAEQVAVLETVIEDFGMSDVADIVENYGFSDDDLMFPVGMMGDARDKVVFAIGYIRGVAREREVTIRQLFEEEGISCERTN
jgi:hypothetical protein